MALQLHVFVVGMFPGFCMIVIFYLVNIGQLDVLGKRGSLLDIA